MNKSKRTTIYDIANKINVSVSTISRVLGNSDYPVSKELRELVLKTAEEMNYRPNLWARNLKRKDSRNIGILLPSISNPFYPSIVKGMEDVAYKNDYTMLICSTDRSKERLRNYTNLLIENCAGGIISIFSEPLPKELDQYIEQGGKVLSIQADNVHSNKACSFNFDKAKEAYTATQHLIELGHKKIAFMSAPPINAFRKKKIEGYNKALLDAGIEVKKEYIYLANTDFNVSNLDNVYDCQIGSMLASELIAKSPEVTGIICMNDLVALGCISELNNGGFDVPKDYSVMGFDDTFFSHLITPKITTIGLEKYNLGKKSMETLIDMIEGRQELKQYNFGDYSKLIIRDSTGTPR